MQPVIKRATYRAAFFGQHQGVTIETPRIAAVAKDRIQLHAFCRVTVRTNLDRFGNAAIPVELWGVVFVSAFVAWGMSEAIARFVWKNGEAQSRP